MAMNAQSQSAQNPSEWLQGSDGALWRREGGGFISVSDRELLDALLHVEDIWAHGKEGLLSTEKTLKLRFFRHNIGLRDVSLQMLRDWIAELQAQLAMR